MKLLDPDGILIGFFYISVILTLHYLLAVTSKILHLPMVSSQPSTSKSSDGTDPALLEINQELELRSKHLSSTLHKLHIWEKKLYDEVKVHSYSAHCLRVFTYPLPFFLISLPRFSQLFIQLGNCMCFIMYVCRPYGSWSPIGTISNNAFKISMRWL